MTANHHLIAWRQLKDLISTLKPMVDVDPDQKVYSFAQPVLDEVLSHAKRVIGPDDPVIARTADLISPEALIRGEPIRASDVLIVASTRNPRNGG